MSIYEFAEDLRADLAAELGDLAEIRVLTVTKNNSVTRTALSVIPKGTCVTPAIYLEDYYRRFREGTCRRTLLLEILRQIREHGGRPFMAEDILSWERASEHLFPMLVNRERNRGRALGSPHRDLLDLTVLYYLRLELEGGKIGTAVVPDRLMARWGRREEELYETAVANLSSEPVECVSIREKLLDFREVWDEDLEPVDKWSEESLKLHVLTNAGRRLGAAAVLCPGLLQRCCREKGWEKAYVLPSSIHELLLLPFSVQTPVSKLQEIVRAVNRSSVAEEEQLSDAVYLYSTEEDRLSLIPSSEEGDFPA